jgi:hypothetical protein
MADGYAVRTTSSEWSHVDFVTVTEQERRKSERNREVGAQYAVGMVYGR